MDELDASVREAIEEDAQRILEGYHCDANYSNINGYRYFVERNQKFHLYLAGLYGKIIPTIRLFADYDWLKCAVSISAAIRAQKSLVGYLFARHYPQVACGGIETLSSCHIASGGGVGCRRWFGLSSRR